ncbi:MAG: protoporphyrinogen oxidase [Planctomycetes bacterium]|nr:protoporphyrinogen oxidase [Planctomycetota bacterium]
MPSQVLVLGAGLSGLSCAFDLARAGRDVRVLEAAPRAGGVVGTLAREGYLFEMGPHTLQASSENFRRLAGDLGLAERLIASRPEGRERYLWHQGALRALPSSIPSMITTPLLSLGGKLRIATEILRRYTPPADGSEPDMESFLVERLGREAALRLGGAFVRGVYAAELRDLGAASAFPRMYAAARDHGGLVRGLAFKKKAKSEPLPGPDVPRMDLLSFPGGLQELVDALSKELGARLLLDQAALSIERAGELWRVKTKSGVHEARELVLALPVLPALELLRSAGIQASEFALVRHAQVVMVHAGFARADLPSFPRGFGFLVPPPQAGSGPGPRALGMIFASNLFVGRAPEDCVSVAGFYRGEELEALDESARIAQAGRDLALALGLGEPPRPLVGATRSWKNVIPRYSTGHRARVRGLCATLTQRASGVHLAGPWVDGVSVEMVIARGRRVARALLEGTSSEPAP